MKGLYWQKHCALRSGHNYRWQIPAITHMYKTHCIGCYAADWVKLQTLLFDLFRLNEFSQISKLYPIRLKITFLKREKRTEPFSSQISLVVCRNRKNVQ